MPPGIEWSITGRDGDMGPIDFTPLIYFGIGVGVVITLVIVGPVWWLVSWVLQHIQWVT